MMTEIIKESNKRIKKANEITSEQVLAWARRVEAQRIQEALTDTTKENKGFNAMKNQEQKNNTLKRARIGRRGSLIVESSVEAFISPRGAQPMAGADQDVGNSTTLNGCTGTRVCRFQRMTKDTKQFTTHAKMMRTKRCQHRSLIQ